MIRKKTVGLYSPDSRKFIPTKIVWTFLGITIFVSTYDPA